MRILIKGAGDLSRGIACRFYRCGYEILMTDIAVPTAVRRTVSFSRAIYEGSATVEDIEAVYAGSINDIIRSGKIAVIVDEKAEIAAYFQPDVIVDAIIAKKSI